jgi:hypothetical protein
VLRRCLLLQLLEAPQHLAVQLALHADGWRAEGCLQRWGRLVVVVEAGRGVILSCVALGSLLHVVKWL